MTRSSFIGRRSGRLLLCGGVATAALIGAAGTAQAQALGNQICGPLVDGVANCTPGAYPGGIHYGGEYTGDITVRLAEGMEVIADNRVPALHVVTQGGAITVEAANTTLIAENASTVATYVEGDGDITLTLGDVVASTTDQDTIVRAIDTWTDFGDTVIDVGHGRTDGDLATGIFANSVTGAITIRAQSVETNGLWADGISASTNGAISIDVGHVATGGDEARAIVAQGGLGDIWVNAGTISTNGFASDGVVATGAGSISIAVNEIRGEGDYIWGVNTFNGAFDDFGQLYSGHTDVSVGSINLTGDNNMGVNLQSWTTISARLGDIVIDGDYSAGAVVVGLQGATLIVDSARFTGEGSGGVSAASEASTSVIVGSLVSERGSGVAAQAGDGTAYAEAGAIDIGGDFANGIGAGSMGGDAVIRVESVITRGYAADAVAAEAFRGSVRINAGDLTTFGNGSTGVYAMGQDLIIGVRGSIETSGDNADGIISSSTFGDNTVSVAGPVTTRGDFSNGLWVTGRYGLADIRAGGLVSTSGAQSHGILGYGEHGQVFIAADRITTSGEQSDGVHARSRYVEFYLGQPEVPVPPPFTGDIDVRVADVEVAGVGSIGVSARGLGDARLLIGDSFSRHDLAIEADMIGDIALDLRGLARSERGDAVLLKGEDVIANIGAGGRIEGAVDGLVLTVGGRCVLPNPDDGSLDNPCPNPGDDFLYPDDPVRLQPILAGGVATVTNAGTIAGGTGYAIRQTDGRLALTNTGRVLGAVSLAGDDDRFDNAGLFSFSRDSDFGGGTDLLRNTGVVALAEASTPVNVALRNLERFENAGLVDLRNGAVGDRLSISGDFVGQAGSTVALDIDLARGLADRIVIGGAATGSTALMFKGDYSTATLGGLDGLIVVETGAGSAADAFVLADGAGDLGFVGHSLSYDAATRRYALHSAASAAAYRQVGLLQALDGVWTSSSDLVGAQSARSRDAARAGDVEGGFWFAGQAGTSNRDWEAGMTGGGEAGLGYQQEHYGAQFGYDRLISSGVRAGVTAGYGQSSLDFDQSADAFEVSSVNLGAYAGVARGPAFANVLIKYDRHSADITSSAMAGDVDLDGSTWGLDFEAGYRFGNDSLFVEPLAALRWTTTTADDLVSGAQTLAFEDAEDVSARLGFRIGGAQALANGARFNLYGGASVMQSLGDDYALTLVSGERQTVEAERVGTWGRGTFGLSYRTARGLETFAEGQGDVGSGYDGVSARIGMRVRF